MNLKSYAGKNREKALIKEERENWQTCEKEEGHEIGQEIEDILGEAEPDHVILQEAPSQVNDGIKVNPLQDQGAEVRSDKLKTKVFQVIMHCIIFIYHLL